MYKANLFDLSGKVSLVTGAGSGFGRAFCEVLAENGSDVAFSYNTNEAGAKETSDIVAKYGVRALVIKADVSKQEDVKAMFRKVDEEFGKLDVLVNNAGTTTLPARLHEMPLEYWDTLIGVNLSGVFFCMQEGIKMMLRQKEGSIINISSMAAIKPRSAKCGYVAAKAGVIALTKSAAVDYGPDGIRVNAIAPGVFAGTRFGYSVGYTEEEVQKVTEAGRSQIPLGRVATPDELKGLAIYLASDASSFVTGATFLVDGGQTC